jgi:hypothetical protein
MYLARLMVIAIALSLASPALAVPPRMDTILYGVS